MKETEGIMAAGEKLKKVLGKRRKCKKKPDKRFFLCSIAIVEGGGDIYQSSQYIPLAWSTPQVLLWPYYVLLLLFIDQTLVKPRD